MIEWAGESERARVGLWVGGWVGETPTKSLLGEGEQVK